GMTSDRCEWLGDLYTSHRAAVYRLCLRILRNRDEADDACHAVFIRAADSLDFETLATNVRPWLLTVARNRCLDLVRRRLRFGKALTTTADTLDAVPDPQAVVVDRQMLISVFRELAPRERMVLWQSAGERRALADIAQGLRLNYMAAAQVLSRARRHAAFAAARVAAIFGLLP